MDTTSTRSVAREFRPGEYDLTVEATERARAAGLVNASWFKPALDRPLMKSLMQRSDAAAVRDTIIWYALISENDNTFKWLNKAYEVHDDNVPLLRLEPGLRSIRSDPRLADLRHRMGLQ